MNDSPGDCQNREVTEPQREGGTRKRDGGIVSRGMGVSVLARVGRTSNARPYKRWEALSFKPPSEREVARQRRDGGSLRATRHRIRLRTLYGAKCPASRPLSLLTFSLCENISHPRSGYIEFAPWSKYIDLPQGEYRRANAPAFAPSGTQKDRRISVFSVKEYTLIRRSFLLGWIRAPQFTALRRGIPPDTAKASGHLSR